MNLVKGDKIYFEEEKRPYIIKAADERFAICTKPYNPQHTVLYTIVDLKEGFRSTNNLVFNPYDYTVQEDIEKCLSHLQSGETELSRRNRIPLKIKEHRSMK